MTANAAYRNGPLRMPTDRAGETASATGASSTRSRLFIKYVSLFVSVVALALVTNGAFDLWFSYQENKASLTSIQRAEAQAAASKIGQFITEIEKQLGWTTHLPWSDSTLEQRRFDAQRLLRQVPAVTELAQLDASGREQLRVSRVATDVVGSGIDHSQKPEFTEAVARKIYFGPVYFRADSEPYMTLSLAGARRAAGVSVAQVNLKLIWDVVSKIKVGERGRAYVVDTTGSLIAHPDISLVLSNRDVAHLSQVRTALAATADQSGERVQEAKDIAGQKVLTAYAPVAPLGWLVFVESPIEDAYAPMFASMQRTGFVLFGALALAVMAGLFLAGRMVVPIRKLQAGAERIGGGDLSQRIAIKTGDEVEALAEQFNDMAGRLQESYADLEKKVDDRTRKLSESLEQLRTAQDRLVQTEKLASLGQLTAGIAHEIKNPLNFINNFSGVSVELIDELQEVLQRVKADDDARGEIAELTDTLRGNLDRIVQHGKRADSIVKNMLLHSRGGAGEHRRVDINAVVEESLNLAYHGARAEKRDFNITLNKSFDPAAGEIDIFPQEITRVLLNLISNGFYAASKRKGLMGGNAYEPTLAVSTRNLGDRVEIRIRDNGTGIPSEVKEKMFDPFFTTKPPGEGTGLGLSISHDIIVKQHAGSIEVDTQPGEFTEFRITLPRIGPAAAPEARA
ncbi:MAG: HAMP domain-containing protein [Xanthobacteraceae bacterium]|nr:HAMP domain-containing protein [Xanthobacteraceae bacterium]